MQQRNRIRILYAVITVFVVLFATNALAEENIIKIATAYKATTLDPVSSVASGNLEKFGLLYGTLIRYDENMKLVPGLAKSWELSDDGRQLVLHLRDARFSDGSPITAEDVVYSLQRARSKASAYPATMSPYTDVAVVDQNTVALTLKYPGSPLLGNLTIYNTGIVSKDAVQDAGEDNAFQEPVTSGPYQVREWVPNTRLVLEPNPHYWREGYPKNDGAVFIEVPNANTRIAMLLSGDVDAIRQVPWSRVGNLKSKSDIRVPLNPSTVIYIVLVNHDRAPFNDERVRKAAALALNKKAIVKAVTFGHAEPANTTLPQPLQFHYDDFPGIEYDPDKARALIQEAGGVDDKIVIMSSPGQQKKISTLIQAQWAAVGLDSKIVLVDQGTWWSRLIGGDYDAAPNWYLNETLNPYLAVRWALCGTCGNRAYYTNYDNEKVNKLIQQASATSDAEKRKVLYHKIQEITTREVSQIPLYYPPYTHAYSTAIEGLKMTRVHQWTLARAHRVE